jgi:hypothetical protein
MTQIGTEKEESVIMLRPCSAQLCENLCPIYEEFGHEYDI